MEAGKETCALIQVRGDMGLDKWDSGWGIREERAEEILCCKR